MIITIEEFNLIMKILTRSENRSSIRNEFFRAFKQKKNNKKKNDSYNRIYHYVFEISKKRNWIDEIIRFQRVNTDIIAEKKTELLSFFRVISFVCFVDKYNGTRPKRSFLLQSIPKLFPNYNNQVFESINNEFSKLMKFSVTKWKEKNTDIITRLSMDFFHPKWLVAYLQHYWDKNEIELFLNKNNQLKESSVRIITDSLENLSQKRKEVVTSLESENIFVQDNMLFPDILTIKSVNKTPVILSKPYLENKIVIQSKISSIISHLINPLDHEILLDMAAAPGMKSSHIANLMGNQSTLVSVDISNKRITQLKKNLQNNTNKMYSIINADSGHSSFLPLKSNSVDKVLLDAPCSSTGIFWKYPDHKWHSTEKIPFFANIQTQLLKEAIRVLKKNGIGIYSVCSIHYLEGEAIINNFLNEIELVNLNWGNKNSCFSHSLENEQFSEEINDKCRRTFSHLDKTDSFFIAKFKSLNS
ncbi:MAG: methyltransferase domain-containing protein [Candidatus Hodarchaeales archaeon]|jgi:16S rRNA (cytosine967-C5)-methyltransferase